MSRDMGKWNIKGMQTKLVQFIKTFKNPLNNRRAWFSSKPVLKTQQEAFHGASYILIAAGYFIGLSPLSGALGKDASKIRFERKSKKYIYSLIVCFCQMIFTLLCIVNIFRKSIHVITLANVTFYGTTFTTSILFLRLARKWEIILKEVTSSNLDEYIDTRVQFKCTLATVIMLSIAILEHSLSVNAKFAHLTYCVNTTDMFKSYIDFNFDWFTSLNIPYNVPVASILIFLNIVCTLNWSYLHVFIICISLYLSSILEQINKKIHSAEGQFMPSSFWKKLREDYCSATNLVRIFDYHINTITFVSFASNLFFVCLQLFNILSNGLNFNKPPDNDCQNYGSGIFNGYEYLIYLSISVLFVVGRSLSVALIASRVHSATLVVAPVLYSVPSSVYCIEVQRFIEQIHGESVALTGMNFFQVTRQLVLSVAGTIVTYELVLLQL